MVEILGELVFSFNLKQTDASFKIKAIQIRVNAMILFVILLLKTKWLSYMRLLEASNKMPTLRYES